MSRVQLATLGADGKLPADQVPSEVFTGNPSGGPLQWHPQTAYELNAFVQWLGQIYICTTAHTSGNTFPSAGTYWSLLTGSGVSAAGAAVALYSLPQRGAIRTRVRNDMANPRANPPSNGWGHTEVVTASAASLNAVTNDANWGYCAEYDVTVTGGTPGLAVVKCPLVACEPTRMAFARMSVNLVTRASAAAVQAQLQINPLKTDGTTSSGNGRVLATYSALPLNTPVTLEGVWFPDTNGVTAMVYAQLVLVLTIPANGAWAFRVGRGQVTVDPEGRCPSYIDGSMALGSWQGAADNSPSEGWANHSSPILTGFNDNNVVTDPSLWGAATNTPMSVAQDVALLQEAGVDYWRGGVPLDSAIWPSSSGSPNWRNSRLAPFFDALQAAGIKACPIIGGAMTWMTSDNTGFITSLNNQSAWLTLWKAFVQTWPSITAVEFVNEPNLTAAWNPVSAANYTALMKPMYTAIKAVRPDITFLGGSLASYRNNDASGVESGAFLAAMYAAGAKGYMDVVSVHPYPADLSTAPPYNPSNGFQAGFDQVLTSVRNAKAAASDTVPLWITEVGMSTPVSHYLGTPVKESQQAQILNLILGICERSPDIQACFFHTLAESSATADNGNDFGLLEFKSLRRRPAWNALQLGEVPRYRDSVYAQQDGLVLAETIDPEMASSGLNYASGFIILARVSIPRTIVVSQVMIDVQTAGSGLVAGQNLIGLYGPDGNLLQGSGDMSAAWAAGVGPATWTLTPMTIQGGPGRWIWAAILNNGTTLTKFWSATTPIANGAQMSDTVAKVPGSRARIGYESLGGRTSLISLAGLGITNAYSQIPWIGLL